MELFAPRHLLIVLVVCLLVFGTKKLKTIGTDLGGALRDFKKAMANDEPAPAAAETPPVASRAPAAITDRRESTPPPTQA
jgi:sec-independent protein translocase protein TatA